MLEPTVRGKPFGRLPEDTFFFHFLASESPRWRQDGVAGVFFKHFWRGVPRYPKRIGDLNIPTNYSKTSFKNFLRRNPQIQVVKFFHDPVLGRANAAPAYSKQVRGYVCVFIGEGGSWNLISKTITTHP